MKMNQIREVRKSIMITPKTIGAIPTNVGSWRETLKIEKATSDGTWLIKVETSKRKRGLNKSKSGR